jgi:hypothetical protein
MPNTRRFATATSGTRWPQPSKVKREGLHRAEARGSDDKVTANMAATFCERGKGPSRARRASSHQGGECRSRAAFHSQPMSVAGAPQRFAAAMENSLRYRTASESCVRLSQLPMVGYVTAATGVHKKPAATADGQWVPGRAKSTDIRRVTDRCEVRLRMACLGMPCPLSASRPLGFHSS